MTEAQIRDLIAQWRHTELVAGQYSVECVTSEEAENAATAKAFRQCASDLEAALIAGEAEAPAPQPADYDWRQFCVNHDGFSGPTSRCPTCIARSAKT